ncbi:MAG: DUF2333 family protein [Candidatus Competibacteraceae bacterium]
MDQLNKPSRVKALADKSRDSVGRVAHLYHPRTWKEKGLVWTVGLALVTYAIVVIVLGILWSREPAFFDVRATALEKVDGDESKLVPGVVTTSTIITVAETLLYKPGGYLSNDIFPPGLYLDNMPNWEFGALLKLRDAVQALRNDFSRSQTQSVEDKDLTTAHPQFNYDSESWILPSTESEYKEGHQSVRKLSGPLIRRTCSGRPIFTRADNLREYLVIVEKRLGSLAQRLGASVGQLRYNLNLAGDPNAQQSTLRRRRN